LWIKLLEFTDHESRNFPLPSLISAYPRFFVMLPNRCSVKEKGKYCVNSPEFVISVLEKNEEYMVGVTCQYHKDGVSIKLIRLQNEGKIPKGKIKFTELKAVGTDCVRSDPDDLIQL